ncbi:DUF2628 domain-containing protein [Gemmata sp. JC717]|uniref:DUF2628 domain-containing protein n=1 Tax=Gemmata algarum TaxID=2975278 RepID=UPI0021BB47E6|nr:DUF2628 domain-containing protein [Gemmata algarum]MDY3554414.1 DUF2628 domain-containing protein [Gemmata algarum]
MTKPPKRNRPVRPIAYLLVAVAAAALSPSPDAITMLTYCFLPGIVLFELGYFAYRRRPPRRKGLGSSMITAETPTEQEMLAFVGSNAHYYLKSWQPALSGEGGPTGFNWAAFFLPGLWLGYRKMYMAVLVLYGLILAETALEPVVFVWVLKMPEVLDRLGPFVALVTGVLVGTFGNGWYLARARRVIGEVRSLGLSEADHLKALAARGGANPSASVGLFLLFLLAGVVITLIQEAVFGGG